MVGEMVSIVREEFQYGEEHVVIETGHIARQASGAVLVNMEDTVVLVTVVSDPSTQGGKDFLPLTVNYIEKTYAAGRIPGGFFKREGRPSEKETLTSRLIDRPLRPLFPKGFGYEVQVVATVLSLNPDVNPDIPAMLGASAALAVSGIPFNGTLGGARVGYIDGALVLNPTLSSLENSGLDLVVAGTRDAILMVESEAHELSEDIMLEAVFFGHEHMSVAMDAIERLASRAGKPKWNWVPPQHDESCSEVVNRLFSDPVQDAYRIADKQARQNQLAGLRQNLADRISAGEFGEPVSVEAFTSAFGQLERTVVRQKILSGEPRIDGRDLETVRPISIDLGLLPRTHGSALFTRGETQALVVSTLGTGRDAQIIDALEGERKERFMLHYNFPPYSVGETGMVGTPKRREIGHGNLAKRGLRTVMPSEEAFPYIIRVVSEITESNGSSSMATVCGASLALMDAGVPIKSAVAGIAMGLIKEGDNYAVLSDILGDEDYLGDMDFKVAGTCQGVTALQMDIKIDGITREIMATALMQARQGRNHILEIMQGMLAIPRSEMSDYAPRIITLRINPDKTRDVIGRGGATIKALTEATGTNIDITDDGVIRIACPDHESGMEAQRRIEELTAEVAVGEIYEGQVARIADFGLFVTILPGKDGLVHVSQISGQRIEKVSDHFSEGDIVRVKVLEIDRQGRIRLTMKDLNL